MTEAHPLYKELTEWWNEHGNGGPEDPEWLKYTGNLREAVSTKLTELEEAHTNTGPDGSKRFGISKSVGCTRSAGLKWLGHPASKTEGDTLLTWHIGHLVECAALATLRTVGYRTEGDSYVSTQTKAFIDPMFASAIDGVIDIDGERKLLEIKSMGYKFSSFRNGKPVRQGFAALAFGGCRKENPSYWVQMQATMHALGLKNAILLVVAKDIVKAMKDDPYIPSLIFWTENVPYDQEFIENDLLPIWNQTWETTQNGTIPSPYYFNGTSSKYVRLPFPSDDRGWGGPNQEATGTFNPCFGCDLRVPCGRNLR